MKRYLCLGAVLCLSVVWSGCGEVFRPIIIPNPPQFPNPAAAHSVVTLSDNGNVVAGTAMVIDVSGDTDVGIQNIGLNPVHAVLQSATQMLAVNQTNASLPQDSVSRLTFAGVSISNATIIALPSSYDASGNLTTAVPNFVASTEPSQAYVTMPQYQPPQNGGTTGGVVVPSVAVLNTQAGTFVATLEVGANPVALAETLDQKKLYVANEGSGTLNAFNTSDRSTRPLCDASGTVCPPVLSSAPIWLSARADSQQVYVLEQNGTLGYLNTATTAGPDTFTETSISTPGATSMWYDMILNRLYIVYGQQLAIIDVSQSAPNILGSGPIPISELQPSTRTAGDPCATTGVGVLSAVAVTSLPDGSRAYVGSVYTDSQDNICPQVTVIDANNFTVKTATPIPGYPDATNPSSPYYAPVCATARFRYNMAVGGDSSRAYFASCDGGVVDIINTATDTYYLNLPAPGSVRNPIPPNQQPPPQNPTFMLAGP
jgi:hypothetical protein